MHHNGPPSFEHPVNVLTSWAGTKVDEVRLIALSPLTPDGGAAPQHPDHLIAYEMLVEEPRVLKQK